MMIALRLGGVHQMTGFKKLLPGLIRYRSVLLGAILVALVWVTLFFFLNNEHDSAERGAIQNSTNLAGAFEEHLSRSLGEIDRSLIAVRTLYARSAGKFDLTNWLKSSRRLNDDVLQVGIVDRNGQLKFNSGVGDERRSTDAREAEYYRVHANMQSDELVISKPIFDSKTGRWSLQLSRRIEDSDGFFGGVVVATLDPAYLTRIYNSVNIGSEGYIRVIGLDGIVRATSGHK
jgi:hypothetical protein